MRLPLVATLVVLALSILLDLYIFFDIRSYRILRRTKHAYRSHRRRQNRTWSRIYAVFAVLCWAYLIVIIALPKRNGNADIVPIMWMLFSYFTIFFPKVVFTLVSLIGRIPQIWGGRRYYSGAFIGTPLAVSTFLIMWWGALVTRHDTMVNHVDIASDRIPAAFYGYKIVQFSDLHVGSWGNDTTYVSSLVDEINAQQPDLILFTGDLVNRNTDELLPFVPVLSRLKAKDGVYSVLGNHDYGDYQNWLTDESKRDNLAQLKELQAEMGWRMLNNRHAYVVHNGDSIALAGVENWGEPPFQQYGKLTDALSRRTAVADSIAADTIPDRLYTILLTHNPEHWSREVVKDSGIDLSLAGHTHAMQMMLSFGDWRWSPSQYVYERWSGLYSEPSQKVPGRDMKMYVNIGSGEVAYPARIGANPELTVFTLKSSQKKQ